MPPYTPSSPSPHYSSELLPGEQTVEFTRRSASSRPLTGVYRRITDHLSIVLRNQHPGSVCPTYGRGGFIQGDLILDSNAGSLTSVTLKVRVDRSVYLSGFLRLLSSRATFFFMLLGSLFQLPFFLKLTYCGVHLMHNAVPGPSRLGSFSRSLSMMVVRRGSYRQPSRVVNLTRPARTR